MFTGRSSTRGSSRSTNGTLVSVVRRSVVSLSTQRMWWLPLVRSGMRAPQSARGRTRNVTRGTPARGRIRRTNITGWYSRSQRRKRGEKSVISTELPSSA